MTAAVEGESSDSDSGDDESTFVQTKGDEGVIDALTPGKGNCDERLWISGDEMVW